MQDSGQCQYQRNQIECKVWNDVDMQTLNQAIERHGKDWVLIQKLYFPSRKANCIKCKYNYMKRKRNQPVKLKQGQSAMANIKEYQSYLQQKTNQLIQQTQQAVAEQLSEPPTTSVIEDQDFSTMIVKIKQDSVYDYDYYDDDFPIDSFDFYDFNQ